MQRHGQPSGGHIAESGILLLTGVTTVDASNYFLLVNGAVMSALCQFSDCENGFSDIENICGFCNALLLHQTKCMCHYQTLFHDDSIGYVVRCTECEKLQIGYGNIMVTYTQEDFDSFRWWLKKIKDEQHPSQNPTLRCIVIPTPCDGMKLLLSMKELKDFYNMLEQADSELQSLELMRLFTDEKK